MEELDIAIITKRSIHGVFALVSRTFLIRVISLLASFLLTVFLSPSVFGIFFVVSAVISFLSYFSDIGLAAALVQKKEPITEDELKTTFTIQQLLVVTVVIIALVFSNQIGQFYNLEKAGILLFQSLAIAFFLVSLKTIPSILLERNLNFQKLVIPEIVETLFFYGTILFFAIQGFEITSFTYGVLARGLSGVIAIYLIAPWKIRFGFSLVAAKRLLSFGIPFQTNSILALIKDELLTIYLGKVLPLQQVGYIGFAQKWSFTPLRVVMDNIIRITFPSFSRLAENKNLLAKAIEKTLFATSLLVFPTITGLVILSSYFLHVVPIPRYQKWEPALLSLSLFGVNALLSSMSTPLTNALNAIGKIKLTLYLMIFWTITTWVLTPIFISFFGFNGVAGASAFISFSVVMVIYLTRRYIRFDIIKTIRYPFIAAFCMGLILYIISPLVIRDLLTFFLMIVVGALLYIGVLWMLTRDELYKDIQIIIQNLKK